MVNTKKTIEQYLVLEILQHFNSGTLIKELRMMAENALLEILNAPKNIVDSAVGEEGALGVWKRFGKDPKNVLGNRDRLTASEISDIIRFFGTVIEKGGAYYRNKKLQWSATGRKFIEEDAKKEGYRAGSDIGTFNKDKFRIRGKAIQAPDWMENLVGATPQNRGIAIKAALDKGVLGKIENTFGLWKGAEISGTTADTIYFMDKFGRGMDPLLNLLPIATLTYNYHHALVEIAMILTMNNRMTYSIASYTSLMPHKAHHPATGHIKKILERFEKRIDNKRMLIFYSGTPQNKIAGCLIFDQENFQSYKELAIADINLWKKFASFNTYPTNYEIATLHNVIADKLQIKLDHHSKSVKSRIKDWENRRFG